MIQVNDDEERKGWQEGRVYGCQLATHGPVANPGLQIDWEQWVWMMFPICKAPGPHSSISEEFLHSIILRPKKPLGS